MTVVAESGPLIHLAFVQKFPLLKHYFHNLLIIPQISDEVIAQGQGRPGDPELRQAIEDGWVTIAPLPAPGTVQRLVAPNLSQIDATVVACALEQRAALAPTDDISVRELAEREGLPVMGSVGVLTQARLDGVIRELKPLLDHLVAEGFHLDPTGRVYQDALRRVGEFR